MTNSSPSELLIGVALAAAQLPDWIGFPLVILIGLGGTWASLRFALPLHDRQSLGKTGRKLKLFAPDAS